MLKIILIVISGALFLQHPQAAHTLESVDNFQLESLRVASKQSNSDAVYILKDNNVIADWSFKGTRKPIETMSVLKSIVAIGIGRLITLEKLKLDTPIHELYPEWNQGQKSQITVRHLLNHTSGLQDIPNAGLEIYPSPNAIKLALAAELSEKPGSIFRYNNKATNLLAGVIEKSYGQKMDHFFANELFKQMGIDSYKWYFDTSGTPHAMAGLELYAKDLAKFGQLILDNGYWKQQELIKHSYLEEMLKQSQDDYLPYGLLWWRLPSKTKYSLNEERFHELINSDIDNSTLESLKPFLKHQFSSRNERDSALQKAIGDDWQEILHGYAKHASGAPLFDKEYGEIIAYYGDGYLGQTLMVIPEYRIVAVRQVQGGDDYNPATDGFSEFKSMVLKLSKEITLEK